MAMQGFGVAIALVLAASTSAPKLVSLDADYGPVENGKRLRMEFREVERRGSQSTVHVVFHSGGSVSSSMFVLSGQCAVAKARGAKYFRQISESESGGVSIYVIAFANAADAPELEIPARAGASAGDGDEGADDVFSKSACRTLGFWH